MRHICSALLFVVVLASEGRAQMQPAAFSRPVASAAPSPQVVPAQVEFLRGASPYAEWGAVIGTVVGVAYAATTVHSDWRKLAMLADGVIGFTAGMAGGMVVFIVKRSIH